MGQTKILVDSNSYFRLAQNIHPLLCNPFGQKNYTLYIHADLNQEFKASSRLRNKFDWVSNSEYAANRKRSITLSRRERQEIEESFEYMWEHAKEAFHQARGKGPSRIDTMILATALVLKIEVVTDDQDMIELAAEYGIQHITSLALMKRMLDENHITMAKIHTVVAQWQYDHDTPYRSWKSEYKSLFGSEPPAE